MHAVVHSLEGLYSSIAHFTNNNTSKLSKGDNYSLNNNARSLGLSSRASDRLTPCFVEYQMTDSGPIKIENYPLRYNKDMVYTQYEGSFAYCLSK